MTDKILENLFANIAAQLRAFEIVLKIFHRTADFGKNAGFFFQIADNGGGAVETLVEFFVATLKSGGEVLAVGIEGVLERGEPLDQSGVAFWFKFFGEGKIEKEETKSDENKNEEYFGRHMVII